MSKGGRPTRQKFDVQLYTHTRMRIHTRTHTYTRTQDGLGQFGGVVFAALINTKFDSDPKRWRMVSSLALDSASVLELLAPAFPALFIPIASVANVSMFPRGVGCKGCALVDSREGKGQFCDSHSCTPTHPPTHTHPP